MIKNRILVVDDEVDFLRIIKDTLVEENFSVILARDVKEARRKIKQSAPDLILLDWQLPGESGIDFLKSLKDKKETEEIPVIMLTIKRGEADVVVGLELGAEDYIAKPFRPKELIARVRAILRRERKPGKEEKVLKEGDIKIVLEKREITVKGNPVNLRPKEFDLLCILLKKKGKVLNRNFLLESVWGYEYFGTTRTVDMTIETLRKKIGKDKIETLKGVGYRFKTE